MTSVNRPPIIWVMDIQTYLKDKALSQEAFAKKLGVTQGAVWQWMEWLEDSGKGTRITAERAKQIEEATDGEIGKHELRPDIFEPPASEMRA